jgi:hypothetical protein
MSDTLGAVDGARTSSSTFTWTVPPSLPDAGAAVIHESLDTACHEHWPDLRTKGMSNDPPLSGGRTSDSLLLIP